MTTTNQTRQFCQHNPYWRDYRKAYEGMYPFMRYEKSYKTGMFDANTLWRNMRYVRAQKEFEQKFQQENSLLINGTIPLKIREFSYYGCCHMSLDGAWRIQILSINEADAYYRKIPFVNDYEWIFHYNGKIDSASIEKAVRAEMEKYLYAPGLFRDIQVLQLLNKKDTLREYKYYIQHRKPIAYLDSDIEKFLKKKFNITFEFEVGLQNAIKWANLHGKQDKLVHLCHYDSRWMLDFDGDVDEVEDEFWETMDGYPQNAVFV